MPRIQITDADLFGDEAAEFEDEEVFASYALSRPVVDELVSSDLRLGVIRAYKGEGKSAVLRMVASKVQEADESAITVSPKVDSIVPSAGSGDYFELVRGWKSGIARCVAAEVGSRIGVAWSGDAMSLVEESERVGNKRPNILRAVLDRLPGVELLGGSVKLDLKRPPIAGVEQLVARWAKGGPLVWVFVDDVDNNFKNTPGNRARLASFFDAVNQLRQVTPELRVRTAIRPNVWATLKMEFESLSHVEQYVRNLTWAEEDYRSLLAARVRGYLSRRGKVETFTSTLSNVSWAAEESLVALVLDEEMPWGGGKKVRPPHVPLYTLSKHRPRWLVELLKAGAKAAAKAGSRRIALMHLLDEYASFGDRRISDMSAEFSAQCPQLSELIDAFRQGQDVYDTATLLALINKKVLNHLRPSVNGIQVSKARDVAALLYEVGLFYARRNWPDGSYEHIPFADQPTLFRSRTDPDQGLVWEIHPVYRQALGIRGEYGQKRRRRT